MKLNTNEMNVLKALSDSSAGQGHDFGFTDEVDFAAIGLNKNQYAGYVSSLKAKGAFEFFEDLGQDAGIDCASVQFQFSDDAFKLLGLDDQIGAR